MELSRLIFVALITSMYIPASIRLLQDYYDAMQSCGSDHRWTFEEMTEGEGAYGSVKQVINMRAEKYALKQATSDKLTAEIRREVEVLKSIQDCPSIVNFQDGAPCDAWNVKIPNAYVMDQYDQDLDRYMTSAAPPKCYGYIFIEVMRAVECMHNSGWMHRDIKPANIFLTTRGDEANSDSWKCKDLQVGIGDFGMAVRGGTEHHQLEETQQTHYQHESMFGNGTYTAVEAHDWHSVYVLYCEMLDKLRSKAKQDRRHRKYSRSMEEGKLLGVAGNKHYDLVARLENLGMPTCS